MPKPYTFLALIRALRTYDSRFEVHVRRGKGSHRMIYHPDIDGDPASFPVKYHGESTELRKGMISAIIRRFELPKGVL